MYALVGVAHNTKTISGHEGKQKNLHVHTTLFYSINVI